MAKTKANSSKKPKKSLPTLGVRAAPKKRQPERILKRKKKWEPAAYPRLFNPLCAVINTLNAKNLLQCDKEDDNSLIISKRLLSDNNIEDAFDKINCSIFPRLLKIHNKENLEKRIYRIDAKRLQELFPQGKLELNNRKKVVCEFKNSRRRIADKRKEQLEKIKEQMFANLKEWSMQTEPFVSPCDKKIFGDQYTVQHELNRKNISRKLLMFFLGNPLREPKKGRAKNVMPAHIFKDEDGSIWVYNAPYETGVTAFLNMVKYLEKKYKDAPLFSQPFQQQQVFYRWHCPKDRKIAGPARGLFRVNFDCLKKYQDIFLNKEIFEALDKVPQCPAHIQADLNALKKRYNISKDNASKHYKTFLLLDSLAQMIQERGYLYDEENYFISQAALESLQKLHNCIRNRYQTIVETIIKGSRSREKVITSCPNYKGLVINREKLINALKKHKIKLVDDDKIPPFAVHINKNKVVRPAPKQKAGVRQQFIQLSGANEDAVPRKLSGKKLRRLAKPVTRRTMETEEETIAPLSPFHHAELESSKQAMAIEEQTITPLDPIPDHQKSEFPTNISDIKEVLPQPAEYDLRNAEDIKLLEERCGKRILINNKRGLKKVRVAENFLLKNPELKEHDRPLGLFAAESFECDELVCNYEGEVISSAEADERAKQKDFQYVMKINEQWCIVGKNYARFINCTNSSANVYYVFNSKTQKTQVRTSRPIKAGEELLADYGCTELLTRDKQDMVEVDERIRGEIYLNPYIGRKGFNFIIQELGYQRLLWDEKITQISQHFYGDTAFDLSGSVLITAIIAGDVDAVLRALKTQPDLLHKPVIRVEKQGPDEKISAHPVYPEIKAAPKHLQDCVYPLALAVYLGQPQMVLALLHQEGVDIDIRSTASGHSPINHALMSKSPDKLEILKLLLRFGACPVLQDAKDFTPLHYCATHDLIEEAKIIQRYWLTEHDDAIDLIGYINKENMDYISLSLLHNNDALLKDFLRKNPELKIEKDKEKLFYFEKPDQPHLNGCHTQAQILNLLEKISDGEQFLQLISQYPDIIYADFIALAQDVLTLQRPLSPEPPTIELIVEEEPQPMEIMPENTVQGTNWSYECLLRLPSTAKDYIQEAEGHYGRYLHPEETYGSPVEYLRNALWAYNKAKELTQQMDEITLINEQLKTLTPLYVNLQIDVYLRLSQEAMHEDASVDKDLIKEMKKFIKQYKCGTFSQGGLNHWFIFHNNKKILVREDNPPTLNLQRQRLEETVKRIEKSRHTKIKKRCHEEEEITQEASPAKKRKCDALQDNNDGQSSYGFFTTPNQNSVVPEKVSTENAI